MTCKSLFWCQIPWFSQYLSLRINNHTHLWIAKVETEAEKYWQFASNQNTREKQHIRCTHFYFLINCNISDMHLFTSIDEPIKWIRRSNTLVRSVSNDFQWRRHLYMVNAATGFPWLNPTSLATHLTKASASSWDKHTNVRMGPRGCITKACGVDEELTKQ